MHTITVKLDFFCDSDDPEIAEESIKQLLSNGAEMYDCGAYNIEVLEIEECRDE